MLRLYHSPTSPFVRKVMVVLHETGLLDQVELVAATGTPIDAGSMPVTLNPLGKIPTLERADAPALYDSRVICRYLADLGGGALYPTAPRLWDTLTLEAMADGFCDAAVLMIYEERARPSGLRHEPWVEGQWSKIARGLDAVEARWMAHLAGPLDCAQIGLGCALGYLDFRHGTRDWRAGRPVLAAWAAKFADRPAMRATAPA